jgi:hypothetical protein
VIVDFFMGRRIEVCRVGERAPGQKRPYFVTVDFRLFVDKAEKTRRFATSSGALAAARLELRMGWAILGREATP